MKPHATPALLLAALFITTPAMATFPIVPIDCEVFDTDSPDFLDHNFAFGTELSYQDDFISTIETGFEGFIATPEQVLQVPDFASGADLPTGGHTLSDLFDGSITPPPFIQDAAIWQSIQGEGSFAQGFSKVTLNQRKLFGLSQDTDDFVDVFGQGKGYAPFYPMNGTGEPIDVRLTIDLFSYFDVTGGGGVSEFLGGALIDVTDPDSPAFMDGAAGFYFADQMGTFAEFGLGQEGETDVTENFFTGPESTDPGARQIASFFYSIDTQVMPGNTYGIGLFGDGAASVDGIGSALLDSQNTLSVSIEVLSTDATLLLPGGLVPEPSSGLLVMLALAGAARRRRA